MGKLTKYYEKSDDSKVYLVASVLDPRVKLRYFESNWKPEWLLGTREKLDEYLMEFIEAMGIDINAVENDDDIERMVDSQDTETTFGSWRVADDVMELESEWSVYLDQGRVKDFPGFSVRRWWINHQDEFKILSQVVLETLAIPAMSTEVERAFSGYSLKLSSLIQAPN